MQIFFKDQYIFSRDVSIVIFLKIFICQNYQVFHGDLQSVLLRTAQSALEDWVECLREKTRDVSHEFRTQTTDPFPILMASLISLI